MLVCLLVTIVNDLRPGSFLSFLESTFLSIPYLFKSFVYDNLCMKNYIYLCVSIRSTSALSCDGLGYFKGRLVNKLCILLKSQTLNTFKDFHKIYPECGLCHNLKWKTGILIIMPTIIELCIKLNYHRDRKT